MPNNTRYDDDKNSIKKVFGKWKIAIEKQNVSPK